VFSDLRHSRIDTLLISPGFLLLHPPHSHHRARGEPSRAGGLLVTRISQHRWLDEYGRASRKCFAKSGTM
jgi:hypothetical protein